MDKDLKIRCEIYTRACGYYRPVNQMNFGKRQEVKERKMYDLDKGINKIIEKNKDIGK